MQEKLGIFVNLRRFEDTPTIREHVARWEEIGADGVVAGDHVFRPNASRERGADSHHGMDQVTLLTVVATLAERLKIATLVSNSGFQHPVLLIRRFAQLAVLYGGDRVYAGFGAGWARREFDALGLDMPPHAARLGRLEEALRIARMLYEDGYADLEGEYVTARKLPLAPLPTVPPRILVAGGSPKIIELAARYADHLDLNVPPHRITKIEPQGRLMTTVDELAESAATLDAEAAAAGRACAVTRSVVIDHLIFCDASEVKETEARICADVGLEPQSLADCPYALVGEPAQMAAKLQYLRTRLGLSWIAVSFSGVERFCAEVAPLFVNHATEPAI